jgi:rod shape-determining protein MreD
MRWLRFAVLLLVASVLQISLVGALSVIRPDIKPDLLLILLVFFAVRCTPRDAVITSFTIGFVADLTSPTMGLMGPRILSFGLFGTLLCDLQGVLSMRRAIYQALTIFVMGLLTATLSCLLRFLRAEAAATNLSAQLLWQPLYSAILGPLLSLPISWWMHMNRKSRRYRGRRTPLKR